MAGLVALALRVREHWLSQGLRVEVPSALELDAVAERIGADLPSDLVTLLRGGLPHDECKEAFWFWPPAELRDATEYGAEFGFVCADRGVVFADYMQESWAYVMWITGDLTGTITLVLDGLVDQPVVGTLEQFLTAYLCDGESLYPPKGWLEDFKKRTALDDLR